MFPEKWEQMKTDTLKLVRSLPGLEYANFNENYDRKTRDYYVKQLVLYVELVKLGKIPKHEVFAIPPYLELAIDLYVSKRATIEFCKWVEKTLRGNGVPAKLYYSKSRFPDPWVWEPYTQFISDAMPLSVPDIEHRVLGINSDEIELRNQAIIQSRN